MCLHLKLFLLKNSINSFTVNDLTTLRDHRPLQIQLINTTINKQEENQPTCLLHKPLNFNIKNYEAYGTELAKEMNPELISLLISNIENCNNTVELKEIIYTTTNMYTNVAKKNVLTTNPKIKNRIKMTRFKKREKTCSKSWYNNECRNLKRNLNYLNKTINRDPRIHIHTHYSIPTPNDTKNT